MFSVFNESEDEFDEQHEAVLGPASRLLYHNAPISLEKALHLLQMARQQHRMTDSCFECILRLLSIGGLLPMGNTLPTTIKTFRKMISLRTSIRTIVEKEQFVIFDFVNQLKSIVTSTVP